MKLLGESGSGEGSDGFDNPDCTLPITMHGSMTVANNTNGGIEMSGATFGKGSVTFNNNAMQFEQITLEGNTIKSALACTGNTGPFGQTISNDGECNTAGVKSGQCKGL